MTDESRFWDKVNKADQCWVWTGAKTRNGYGNCYFNGRYMRAHRISFQLANPNIDIDGLCIDHLCHVTACVNPAHLRVATHKQNQENRAGAQCNSTSGVRGIRWDSSRNKWLARVKHNGRTINVGRFNSLGEASEAVRIKRLELFTHNEKDRSHV